MKRDDKDSEKNKEKDRMRKIERKKKRIKFAMPIGHVPSLPLA